jgi:hypothetical protein
MHNLEERELAYKYAKFCIDAQLGGSFPVSLFPATFLHSVIPETTVSCQHTSALCWMYVLWTAGLKSGLTGLNPGWLPSEIARGGRGMSVGNAGRHIQP